MRHPAAPAIDLHSHFLRLEWLQARPSAGLQRSLALLADLAWQLESLAQAGIAAKVLTAPPALLAAPGSPTSAALMMRVNDGFAELVATHPGLLYAMATIDVFQGDVAAREVERAAEQLGMRAICIDCAAGDRYLDDPSARPALDAAAAHQMAIFIHPVYPPGMTERLARIGHAGILMARGTEAAASTLALLRSGILADLPGIQLVLPMIAAGALIFAGYAHEERARTEGWRGPAPIDARRQIAIDTMGFDPGLIRYAVDLVGYERVLFGSDWPIMPISTYGQIVEALDAAGLSDDQQAAVLGGNALRMLGARTA
jgi:predicted TIM-barrel fold metal-dependent hydrolase